MVNSIVGLPDLPPRLSWYRPINDAENYKMFDAKGRKISDN